MAGIEETQPIEAQVAEAQKHVPEPALIRSAVLAAVSVVGVVVGYQVDVSWLEPVLSAYAVAAPMALGWWIRRNVSPSVGRHRAPR